MGMLDPGGDVLTSELAQATTSMAKSRLLNLTT
jgi:hypothetical protein